MRVRFTILICALLVLGLAVSQADAQGYRVGVRANNVVEYGNNQELGAIRLTHRSPDQGSFNIVQNDEIEITFGGLTITNVDDITANNTTAPNGYITTTGDVVATLVVANDDDKVGKVTIRVSMAPAVLGGNTITVRGIRADVSGLEAGDTILATVSATGSGDGFSDVTETTGSSVTGVVSTVKDGLTVTAVGQVSVLTCDDGVGTNRMPSITVEEGFNDAWETGATRGFEAATDDTQIRIVVANVPSGVTFRWPGDNGPVVDGTSEIPPMIAGPVNGGAQIDNPAYLADPVDNQDRNLLPAHTENSAPSAMLDFVSESTTDDNKAIVIYNFMGVGEAGEEKGHDALKNKFVISPEVTVDTSKTGMGGVSDAWAQLWPMKGDSATDTADKLSYAQPVETKDAGYFVNVTECVTYLLFPFLTCGAQADWTTGIAVANTSADDEAFPVNSGAAPQAGSVMIHAYPKSTAAEKAAVGHNSSPEMLTDPISATLSGNLAAGDSMAMTCNTHPMLAGFEGYAIVRAGFRHAHGMAFVLGNFMDGAAVDVAHGYIALVIPDPEFEGTAGGPQGRGAADGESLGQ